MQNPYCVFLKDDEQSRNDAFNDGQSNGTTTNEQSRHHETTNHIQSSNE